MERMPHDFPNLASAMRDSSQHHATGPLLSNFSANVLVGSVTQNGTICQGAVPGWTILELGSRMSLCVLYATLFRPEYHTGNSAFLLPPPILSSACCIYGPTTGTFPANPPIVEKKSPKRIKIPYSSIRKPTRGHRSNISTIPTTNAAVPFNFCRRAKNSAVF